MVTAVRLHLHARYPSCYSFSLLVFSSPFMCAIICVYAKHGLLLFVECVGAKRGQRAHHVGVGDRPARQVEGGEPIQRHHPGGDQQGACAPKGELHGDLPDVQGPNEGARTEKCAEFVGVAQRDVVGRRGASSSSSSSKSNVNAPDEDDEKKEVSGESAETPRSAPSDPAARA